MSEQPGAALPIEVRSLTKSYRLGFFLNKRVQALQGIDLSIQSGQVYGLLGPNGAGKSTTIKILLNLVQATSGEAKLFGLNPQDKNARRRVGFVPENPAPYEYLTGREFVHLSGKLAGLSGKELDDRVKEVLGLVGMERAAALQIRRYSKGMIQRVALAQGIIHKPALLILDEPTSGLDPLGRRQMRDLILEERLRGTTVLFCTHIIPDVEALCDQVAVLVGGKRVREGSVKQLLSADQAMAELTIEGLNAERVRGLASGLEQLRELDGRLLVQVRDSDAQALLKAVIAAGGKVTRLQAARFSLEELFLQALKEAKSNTVGSELS
jgi:ABC-2 type transport system ATP-binding protein